MKSLLVAGALAPAFLLASTASAQTSANRPNLAPLNANRPNVLFFSIDDLRPATGAYGDPLAKTPNIDRLSATGTTFLRAYCQQAVCSPSRVSLMTGLRPDATRIYDLRTHFRTTRPDAVTLTQYFKSQGYFAQGMGKIYHPGLDDAPSWSVPSWQPKTPNYGPQGEADEKRRDEAAAAAALAAGKDPKAAANNARGAAWEATSDVPDNYFRDGAVADHAVETLRGLKGKNQPFFLAVGFAKPHLPFVAPKKYWDLYRESDFKLPANYRTPPIDAPPLALHSWGELRAYADMPPAPAPLTDAQALKLIHGYYASTSYMDAQLGRVLNELDRLKLRDNTIIVLWSDHGYHLGDHSMWNKHTNFEIATRVPLIFSLPGQKTGIKVPHLAELVDVYPTLCAAAGLPVPAAVQGQSLLSVLRNPSAPSKAAAFSQYPRTGAMGYSIRTDNFRYTEWIERPSGKLVASELYDHRSDPAENRNVASRPEHQAVIARLSEALRPIRDEGHAAGQEAIKKATAVAVP